MRQPSRASPRARKRIPGPSQRYRLLRKAICRGQQIAFIYRKRLRQASPVVLGYSASGEEKVFVYQFGGATSPGSRLPEWRCFRVAEMGDLELQEGERREGASHKKPQTCVRCVDADANIPETLRRRAALCFGSPHLRPPRRGP